MDNNKMTPVSKVTMAAFLANVFGVVLDAGLLFLLTRVFNIAITLRTIIDNGWFFISIGPSITIIGFFLFICKKYGKKAAFIFLGAAIVIFIPIYLMLGVMFRPFD